MGVVLRQLKKKRLVGVLANALDKQGWTSFTKSAWGYAILAKTYFKP